jgi:hypothetical protein
VTWPSAFAAGTLGYMKDRIANELGRDDLTSQIAAAINDAIIEYQKERFRFSESRDTTFNTVIGQDIYTSADSSVISSHFYMDYMVIFVGDVPTEMTRRTPLEIEMLQEATASNAMGTPEDYCFYNDSIRMYPTPAAVYQVRIAAHLLIAAPATDNEAGNRWMVDAERLIRSRAKYQLAVHYTKDGDEIMLMSPDPPAPGQNPGQAYLAFRALKGEGNKVTATGRIKAMNL